MPQNPDLPKILYVSAECAPYVKAGGLGDVASSLPPAIKGFEMRMFIPFYPRLMASYKERFCPECTLTVPFSKQAVQAQVFKTSHNGIICYALYAPGFFEGSKETGPYEDTDTDNRNFLFFTKAVLAALPLLGYLPDIFHLNDWHCCYFASLMKQKDRYANSRTLLTVHNSICMGVAPFYNVYRYSGLPLRDFLTGPFSFRLRLSNPLKGGILTADAVSTVSPSYAEELSQKGPGNYLARYFRQKGPVTGILNGIDYQVYDPKKDQNLPLTYDKNTFQAGKSAAKKELQKRFGLAINADTMVLSMVSRFTSQKGSDLVCKTIPALLKTFPDLQFVFLGNAEGDCLSKIRELVSAFPGQVGAWLQFSDTLPSIVYAGSDGLLMPSLYEPCGLGQMIAMAYGTVPIARDCGGLKDTISPYIFPGSQSATGFLFEDYSEECLMEILLQAYGLYKNQPQYFNALILECMEQDHSWNHSAARYEALYQKLLLTKS